MTPGEAALSRQLAEARRQGWLDDMLQAEKRHGLPAGLLAAIASRETNMRDIVGDQGHGRGLMQIDDRSHQRFLERFDVGPGETPPADEAIRYAAAMIGENVASAVRSGVPPSEALPVAVAGYNAGVRAAFQAWKEHGNPDRATTGGDYSKDVLGRTAILADLLKGAAVPPPVKPSEFPITLVSPHARGPHVRTAQHALTGNRYRDFMEGSPVDGEFGPWTARATFRAKHELGFIRANQQYGQDLHDLLTGKKQLTAARRQRRKQRLKEKAKWTRGEITVRMAARDVGLTESPPGSNRNRISIGFGIIGAWCAMAVSTWAKQAGSSIPIIGKGVSGRYYYCPTIFNDATSGANGLTLVKWIEAKMGCWPLFDWGDDRVADHVEVLVCKPSVASSVARAAEVLKDYPTVASQVAKFAEAQKGNSSAFITIGGNTSFEGQSGSQSDGGAVAVRVRFVSDVAKNIRGDLGFVRLER